MKIDDVRYDDNDRRFYTLTVQGEQFKDVEPLNVTKKNCADCNLDCKNKKSFSAVLRTFDCEKNANRVRVIYNFLTGAIVTTSTMLFYGKFQLGFFKGTAAIIVLLVILDIVCCVGEGLVEPIRDRLFYKKLKKQERIKQKLLEKEKQTEEADKVLSEIEKNKKNPNRVHILRAEKIIENMQEASKLADFGKNTEIVTDSISLLLDIVNYMKNDSSNYNKVAYLLDIYLPEFYNSIKNYVILKNTGYISNEFEEIILESFSKFYNYLKEKHEETEWDKTLTEINLKISVEHLSELIEEEEKENNYA